MKVLSIEFKSSYQGVCHYLVWTKDAEPFRIATHDNGRVTWTNSPEVLAALQARHDAERDKALAKYPEYAHLMSPRIAYYLEA